MLSYRFMRMSMAGNRDGTERLDGRGAAGHHGRPARHDHDDAHGGSHVRVRGRVALMVMGRWLDRSMNHQARTGGMFEAASSGLGDASLAALAGLKRTGSVRAHLNADISIPVGSVNEVGENPMSMGVEVQMPYPMQLGSGSWDLQPGITILGMSELTSWGLQGTGTFRLNRNSRGYRRGNAIEGTGWFAVKPADRLSLSGRVLFRNLGNHAGLDPAYGNRMMAPIIREELRGGTRVDIPLGVNLYFPSGALKGHRIAAEWQIPVFQSLRGPQIETDWVLTVGWQKSFEPIGRHRSRGWSIGRRAPDLRVRARRGGANRRNTARPIAKRLG